MRDKTDKLPDCVDTGKTDASRFYQDMFSDVFSFMKEMNQRRPNSPTTDIDTSIKILRMRLIGEEYDEYCYAVGENDLPGIADALVDILYVTIGAAVAYGIDIRPLWCLVHQANMTKASGPVREDGKRLKPDGWQPPDIKGEIERQIAVSKSNTSLESLDTDISCLGSGAKPVT